jgi:hypothetical protein
MRLLLRLATAPLLLLLLLLAVEAAPRKAAFLLQRSDCARRSSGASACVDEKRRKGHPTSLERFLSVPSTTHASGDLAVAATAAPARRSPRPHYGRSLQSAAAAGDIEGRNDKEEEEEEEEEGRRFASFAASLGGGVDAAVADDGDTSNPQSAGVDGLVGGRSAATLRQPMGIPQSSSAWSASAARDSTTTATRQAATAPSAFARTGSRGASRSAAAETANGSATPWQEDLEELLNPLTSLEQRRVRLVRLVDSNEQIRKSVAQALQERTVSRMLFLSSAVIAFYFAPRIPSESGLEPCLLRRKTHPQSPSLRSRLS